MSCLHLHNLQQSLSIVFDEICSGILFDIIPWNNNRRCHSSGVGSCHFIANFKMGTMKELSVREFEKQIYWPTQIWQGFLSEEHNPMQQSTIWGGSMMSWGCFSSGSGNLVPIDGIMNSNDRFWKKTCKHSFWIWVMDDDGSYSKTNLEAATTRPNKTEMTVLPWPANSHDLNPTDIYGKTWKLESIIGLPSIASNWKKSQLKYGIISTQILLRISSRTM
jgi:hypothetical protein